MAVPTRPAAGAPIASAWGQVAHDAAVAMDFQMGTATVTAASGSGSLVVTFPRPFGGVPTVIACTAQGSTFYFSSVGAPSATAVTLNIRDIRDAQAGAGAILVAWFAYGPRA